MEHTWPEFTNSRLKLGVSLIEKGMEVHALLPKKQDIDEYRHKIESAGLKIFTYDYEKNTTAVMSNLKFVKIFRNLFKQNEYDIIHSFKFQPNLYTVLASLFSIKSKIVLHVTGLGIVFASPTTFKKSILKFVSKCIFLFNFLFADKIIFQNEDDVSDLWLTSFFKKKLSVIEGSGVDVERFNKSNFDVSEKRKEFGLEGKMVITFISRLVSAKGVHELLNSIEILVKTNPDIILLVVGSIDKDNPDSLSKEYISQFDKHTNIRFLGYRKDTAEILAVTDIYAYPSYYREGVPRTVLEALSTGIPIITTDMPGCKLTVLDGENGYLIEPRSTIALKLALERLLNNEKRDELGAVSRQIAVSKFEKSIIYNKIIKIYSQLIK